MRFALKIEGTILLEATTQQPNSVAGVPVSETRGDGLGYDVLSFEANGKKRLMEVKTAAFGSEAPHYVTRTELALSQAEPDHFRQY